MGDKMKENKDAESGEPVQLDKDKEQEGGQPQRPPQQPGQQQGGQPQRPPQQPDQQQGGQQHEGGQKR
jgi:hypothetical protein